MQIVKIVKICFSFRMVFLCLVQTAKLKMSSREHSEMDEFEEIACRLLLEKYLLKRSMNPSPERPNNCSHAHALTGDSSGAAGLEVDCKFASYAPTPPEVSK